MISDKNAERIARDILKPFTDMGMVSDGAMASAIELVKVHCERDDIDKRLESADASVAMHTFLVAAFKGLPEADTE